MKKYVIWLHLTNFPNLLSIHRVCGNNPNRQNAQFQNSLVPDFYKLYNQNPLNLLNTLLNKIEFLITKNDFDFKNFLL